MSNHLHSRPGSKTSPSVAGGHLVGVPPHNSPVHGRGTASIVVPAKLSPTGVLFRITEVDPSGNNRAEGAVRPGVAPLWQTVHGGTWNQLVTSGSGIVDLDGRQQRVRAGDRLAIPADTPFALLNDSTALWTFQLLNPSWGTTRFSYRFGDTALAGDEVWFKMRAAPEDLSGGGPTFRLASAGPGEAIGDFVVDPTLCVALLDVGAQTAGQLSTEGTEHVSVIAGDIQIGFKGTVEQPALVMRNGETLEIPSGTLYYLVNRGSSPGLFMIEPSPPRVWTPESILWDLGDGNLQTGDRIWFELVLPF